MQLKNSPKRSKINRFRGKKNSNLNQKMSTPQFQTLQLLKLHPVLPLNITNFQKIKMLPNHKLVVNLPIKKIPKIHKHRQIRKLQKKHKMIQKYKISQSPILKIICRLLKMRKRKKKLINQIFYKLHNKVKTKKAMIKIYNWNKESLNKFRNNCKKSQKIKKTQRTK